MRRIYLLLMTAIASPSLGQTQKFELPPPRIVAGSLSGTVTASDGKPVSGAVVILRLQPNTGINLPDFTVHAVTNPAGAFSLATLPVGKYTLCPQAPDQDVLNPCDWSRQPPEVEILNGRAAAARLVMAKGHRVTLQVNDAGQLLASSVGRARPPSVTVGVTTPYGFLAARATGRLAIRRDFVMVVPYATPVDALIMGAGVDLEDDKGKKAANQVVRIPLRLKEGDPPKSVSARITGAVGEPGKL